jgi:hypothetical protein
MKCTFRIITHSFLGLKLKTLKMEARCSSETLTATCQTAIDNQRTAKLFFTKDLKFYIIKGKKNL